MEEYKGTGIIHCDTEEEHEELLNELTENPDFTELGQFDMVQDIYEELEYQGFTEEQIDELSNARYGNCLEIIEYLDHYDAFIGAR